MTQVRFPVPTGQAANPGPARLSLKLVTVDGAPVLGFVAAGLVMEYADLALTADLTLDLVPQSAIALPDGAATYYAVAVQTRGRTERYLVQVPDSPNRVELRDLVGAAAIDGSGLVGQLMVEIHAAADATAGDRVQTGLDAQATAGDRVQTGLDAQATAGDRVQTGLDAQATAGDRVQTGLDAQATAGDRVQTGLDAQTAAQQASLATNSASAAASFANLILMGF